MKQSLDDTYDKQYSVKYWSQQNMVEVWSVQRLPFEPKDWLVDLRNDIRTGIHCLQSNPGQILHAIYSSSQAGLCDTENVLFYNVGLAHFASLMTTGLRFERCYLCPDSPTPGVNPRYRTRRIVNFSVRELRASIPPQKLARTRQGASSPDWNASVWYCRRAR